MEESLGIGAMYHDKFRLSPMGSDGALHFTDDGLVQIRLWLKLNEEIDCSDTNVEQVR